MLVSRACRSGVRTWSALEAPAKSYINGEMVGALSGREFVVQDPATLKPLTSVPDMGSDDVAAAVSAAEAALPGWRALLAKERSAILRNWFDLVKENADALAHLATSESGKPLAEARGEVDYGASFLEWFSEEAKRTYGEVIPETVAGRRLLVLKQPVGVCGLLTPWNFPIAMLTRKAGPALAAGCTTVIKPAEDTPLSTLALCELAHEAGVPAGVLNVVTCSRDRVVEVGAAMCASPTIRKLSFTGSTPVGVKLAQDCAPTMKRMSMELGGNAPFIVFDDADVDAAVEGLIASKFRNSGQTCVCANRLYVQAGVVEEFGRKLAERVSALPVGHGLEDSTKIGPLINAAALDKVSGLVTDAVEKGAQALSGGSVSTPGDGLNGAFFEPTVLTGIKPNMAIASTEIFGPVAPITTFNNEDEVIAMANDIDVGLAGYFYSRDLSRVFRVAEALEVGMVAVNEGALSTEVAPFGGVKMSGMGREGARQGMAEYMEEKYVCLGGL